MIYIVILGVDLRCLINTLFLRPFLVLLNEQVLVESARSFKESFKNHCSTNVMIYTFHPWQLARQKCLVNQPCSVLKTDSLGSYEI